MAETRTRPTPVDPAGFVDAAQPPARAVDGRRVMALMERVSGHPPVMWGPSMVGFGAYRYRYESGHSGEAMRIGFSPRKAELVLYVLTGSEAQAELLARLGPHRTGKSCLYLKSLDRIDMDVLEAIVAGAWAEMAARHPPE